MARKWISVLAAVLIIFLVVITVLVDLQVKASILEIARTQAQLRAVEVINESINNNIVSGTNYQDLVSIQTDSNQRVVMLQANTVVINQLMARTVNEVIKSNTSLQAKAINIPLGQVTGNIMLIGRGPSVSVRVLPVQQVHVEVDNRFEQAGINQTRHIISFKINTRIKIAVPLASEELPVTTTIPIADTVIVGEVPHTYVNFSGGADAFIKGSEK
ncbi:MAG: sporulation protein YunB [Syntrophomonadaceae bacterium]|nr:sporulation protein YunB [Syntrophomonadaceae bacterium]